MPFQGRMPRIRRLTRAQLLTLTTWRWASVKLDQSVHADDILQLSALHATLATLRDVRDPFQLFARHADAHPEFSLIVSLAPRDHSHDTLSHDILDTAFWLRWNELTRGRVGFDIDPAAHNPDAWSTAG